MNSQCGEVTFKGIIWRWLIKELSFYAIVLLWYVTVASGDAGAYLTMIALTTIFLILFHIEWKIPTEKHGYEHMREIVTAITVLSIHISGVHILPLTSSLLFYFLWFAAQKMERVLLETESTWQFLLETGRTWQDYSIKRSPLIYRN